MKYIELDRYALIDQIKSSHKKRKEKNTPLYQWLTVFLNNPSVKELINNCDIKNLYKKFDQSELGQIYVVSLLNEILIAADIDILQYIDEIPENCFYAFFEGANIQITVPKHIKSIGTDAFREMGVNHINYEGTMSQFNKIEKSANALQDITEVNCSDGIIHLEG